MTVLLETPDAETVVITTDHGEAFGESGAHGHPDGLLLPEIEQVPWAETTATDLGWREPTLDRASGSAADPEAEVGEHLADVGST